VLEPITKTLQGGIVYGFGGDILNGAPIEEAGQAHRVPLVARNGLHKARPRGMACRAALAVGIDHLSQPQLLAEAAAQIRPGLGAHPVCGRSDCADQSPDAGSLGADLLRNHACHGAKPFRSRPGGSPPGFLGHFDERAHIF
jgi:hypothetical protein